MTPQKGYRTSLTRAELETALKCHTNWARWAREDGVLDAVYEEDAKVKILRWVLFGEVY